MRKYVLFDNLTRHILLGCLILVEFIATMPISSAFADTEFHEIDTFVESQMQELHIPGLALAVVQDNRIVYIQGYGITDPSGRPVTPQTPFIIGSMTKSFTALAIMQLVEQGKIDLDSPVQRYIPWFRVADPASSNQITVRHLLNQTSGISTADGNGDLTRDDTTDNALQRRAHALQSIQLTQPVGATFQYSNANYDLLGLLVEVVSGQSYENYIQEHIFTPLDMHHSATSPTATQADGLAVGYRYWFGIPAVMKTPFPRGSLPSGYLISSAEDLSHYLIAEMNDGHYKDASVLSPEGIAELHRPMVAAFDGNQYAMGWFVGRSGDMKVIWHNGTVPGFNAKMMFVPSQGLGVVALMNASSQINEARKEAIVDGVVNLLQGVKPEPTQANQVVTMLYAVITLIAIIPLVNLIKSISTLRRWRADPSQRPHGARLAWSIGIPSGMNLFVLFLFLILQPQMFGISLRSTLLLSPDIGSIMIVSIAVALCWFILCPFLFRQLIRRNRYPYAGRKGT